MFMEPADPVIAPTKPKAKCSESRVSSTNEAERVRLDSSSQDPLLPRSAAGSLGLCSELPRMFEFVNVRLRPLEIGSVGDSGPHPDQMALWTWTIRASSKRGGPELPLRPPWLNAERHGVLKRSPLLSCGVPACNPGLRQLDIVLVLFNAHILEALQHSANTAAPAAAKRIEDAPARRAHGPGKLLEKLDGLQAGMPVLHACRKVEVALAGGDLRAVKILLQRHIELAENVSGVAPEIGCAAHLFEAPTHAARVKRTAIAETSNRSPSAKGIRQP